MPNNKKTKENKRSIQTKVYVSKHDLKAVGGKIEMSNILRSARDKAVSDLCGCEICKTSKPCQS